MHRGDRGQIGAVRLLWLAAAWAGPATADVNLQWRPVNQTVMIDDTADIALFAISDNNNIQFMASLEVILSWDPNRLELVGIQPEHDEYEWLGSFFPDDRALDGINDDCEDGRFCNPYSGHPVNDGTAFYVAWGQLAPAPPAQATPGAGLLVTTFRFRALRSGVGRLQFVAALGEFSRSRVISGIVPGREITGTLGPAAQVTIQSCATSPNATAEGPRYLGVAPAEGDSAVALWLSGHEKDSQVACISGYLQPNGRLAQGPVYLTPLNWGTVYVTGVEVVPGASYTVHADCGTAGSPDLSGGSPVQAWRWGDVNHDGSVNGDDVLLVLDASQGIFNGISIRNVDIAGCVTDGLVNADDVLGVIDAVQGLPYPCPRVCEITVDGDDWIQLTSCLSGPDSEMAPDCTDSNLDRDGDVDLADAAAFQNLFQPAHQP